MVALRLRHPRHHPLCGWQQRIATTGWPAFRFNTHLSIVLSISQSTVWCSTGAVCSSTKMLVVNTSQKKSTRCSQDSQEPTGDSHQFHGRTWWVRQGVEYSWKWRGGYNYVSLSGFIDTQRDTVHTLLNMHDIEQSSDYNLYMHSHVFDRRTTLHITRYTYNSVSPWKQCLQAINWCARTSPYPTVPNCTEQQENDVGFIQITQSIKFIYITDWVIPSKKLYYLRRITKIDTPVNNCQLPERLV